MVRSTTEARRAQRGFPRPREDGPNETDGTHGTDLLSPLAWGWSGQPQGHGAHRGVFRACMGMVRMGRMGRMGQICFPRARKRGQPIDRSCCSWVRIVSDARASRRRIVCRFTARMFVQFCVRRLGFPHRMMLTQFALHPQQCLASETLAGQAPAAPQSFESLL